MLPELQEFAIPVYISDDSTNCETQEVISSLERDYPFLFYRHNKPRLGHDDNFFSTLKMADTDYVWYLGDSMFVKPGGFDAVLNALESDPDFCFVNSYVDDWHDRHLKPQQTHGFLVDRAWYLTLSGATIYSRKARVLQVAENRKQQWKNFPQLGLVLEYCSLNKARCEWLGKPIIEVNQNKKSYWAKQAFSVFVRDWSALVRSFPGLFSDAEADKVIRSHSDRTGLFGPWGLVRLRAQNVLNRQTLSEFEVDFETASGYSPWAKFLCHVPQSVCQFCLSGARRLRKTFMVKRGG